MGKPYALRWLAALFICTAPLAGCSEQVSTVAQLPSEPLIWYVQHDAVPGGDGRTWDTAFRFPQDALAIARDGDTIRVAQGTYHPDQLAAMPYGTGDRAATFLLREHVAMIGGYAGLGAAAAPDANDPARFVTTLSGELAGAGALNHTYSWETRALHVVTARDIDRQSYLVGFTVRGGYANGADDNQSGGGMLIHHASPTVHGCTFTDNYALMNGGALAAMVASVPSLVDDSFVGNRAEWGMGGAVFALDGAKPRVTGGYMVGNTAGKGGGLGSRGMSAPALDGVTFWWNEATAGSGGAIYAEDRAGPDIEGCTFIGNRARDEGGAYYLRDVPQQLMVENSVFDGNQAGLGGGAVRIADDAGLRFINCTFASNEAAAGMGGAILAGTDLDIQPRWTSIVNTIAWGDLAARADNELAVVGGRGALIEVYYSDVQGSGMAGQIRPPTPDKPIYYNEGDIEANPLFVNAAAHDLRLQAKSPCIDAGANDMMPASMTVDVTDGARFSGGLCGFSKVDMGAFEFQATCHVMPPL